VAQRLDPLVEGTGWMPQMDTVSSQLGQVAVLAIVSRTAS